MNQLAGRPGAVPLAPAMEKRKRRRRNAVSRLLLQTTRQNRSIAIRRDAADDAVAFTIWPGAKEERRNKFAVNPGDVEIQGPQAIHHDGIAHGVGQGPEEGAGMGVEGIDDAVAEIADQQRVAELAEMFRRLDHAPGGIEGAVRHEPAHEAPALSEHVHETIAGPCLIIFKS